MADYKRKYPDAPTPEEIKAGYAPSTVNASLFIKFGIWTAVGLAVAYAIGYGSVVALNKVDDIQNERYLRMSARQTEEFSGPRLQPSPGHDRVDEEDMQILSDHYKQQMIAKKMWQEDPQKRSYGQPGISDAALAQARTAMQNWGQQTENQGNSQAKPQQ